MSNSGNSRRQFLQLGAMAASALTASAALPAESNAESVIGMPFTATNPRLGLIGTGGSALRGHGVAKLRHDLGALMRPGPWLYRRTRFRTRRCACSPPKSRARKSSSACMMNCPINRRSKPKSGRTCRTVRRGSSRPSTSCARATRRSSSARAGAPSRRSAWPRERTY